MGNLQLVRRSDLGGQRFNLDQERLIWGRGRTADICFPDGQSVSRLHVEILVQKDRIRVRDLGSTNGTFVNGRRVSEAEVYPGDVLMIGELELALVLQAPAVSEPALRTSMTFSPSALQTVSDVSTMQLSGSAAFRLLYQVSSELIRLRPTDGLLSMAVELVRDVLKANHVYLYLLDSEGKLYLAAANSRVGRSSPTTGASRTLLEKVKNERVAVLAGDVAADSTFGFADSIMESDITSLMGAPLLVEEELLGVIAADFERVGTSFSHAHLELLSAAANLLACGLRQSRLMQEIERASRVRQRLAQFHSPRVVQAILDRGEGLSAEKRDATVWFCDIHGFTNFAELRPPEEVEQLIGDFFELAVDVIFGHEGTLDKYLGDGFMAVFGAPFDQEDAPLRAVQAAIDVHSKISERNRAVLPGQGLQIRSGINSGCVIAGDIGAAVRKDYSVLGDAVNIAARLQSDVAKVNEIVIGPTTAHLVKATIPCKSLGHRRIRGRKNEIEPYLVILP